ncbi:MAG: type V CRISPR-associated protein Cas12d/CasY [Microgenomates group bacterium]
MTNQKKISGYRLHKERVLFSGGEIIRTIKYPLSPINPSQEITLFLKKFEDALISDDLKIRGDMNLNDYLIYTTQGKTAYTLFDFWKDSIKAGVIWMPTPAELINFLIEKYKLPSIIDLIWNNASPRITQFFEKERFKDILKSDPVRSNNTKNSFYIRIVSYLKKEFFNKEGKNYEISYPEVKKEVDFIINSFFDSNGKLLLEGKKQDEFWKKEYNLDKSLIENAKPKGKYADITFAIIPELISDYYTNQKLENLIEKRAKWLEEEKLLQSILGLSNNFNGFSNYFGKILEGLQKDESETEEIYQALKVILPVIDKEKDKVLSALNFLSEKAKLLGKTSLPLVNGWHDYRSFFGGKIQSWFTNSLKRKNELEDKISQFKESLKKAKKYLENQQASPDAEKEKKDILELILIIENFFTDENKSIKIEENYQIFDSLLSLLKRALNFYYQKYIQKEGDEIKVNKFEPFQGIYPKIDKPVAFYGQSARRINEKIINQTIPIIEDGIENIKKIILYLKDSFSILETFDKAKKSQETIEDVYRKFLQFFWNKYTSLSINSTYFKEKFYSILIENIDENETKKITIKNSGRYVIYKSPYAKGATEKLSIKNIDYQKEFEKSVLSLTDFLFSFKNEDLLKDTNILLDWIELSKNIISLLLRYNSKESYQPTDLHLDHFSQAKRYFELFNKNQYSKNEFSFIIQSLILSEVRGAATLYSKKDYTAKYSIQVISSNTKFKLYYLPKSPLNNITNKKQLMQPHSYAVCLGANSSKKNGQKANVFLLNKDNIQPAYLSEEVKNYLFKLSSSYYQIQFLDKFIYRPKGWEDIDINLSEWSFVVEKNYQIVWDLETKKPKLILKTQDKKNKIYLTIPFILRPKSDLQKIAPLKEIAKGNDKEEKDLSRLNYPILGVDVGEYGLAYCLVKFDYDKNNYSIINAQIVKDDDERPVLGFINDKNIASIKDKFSQIQQRSRKGAFDEEDTIISQIRENAIGRLRNKIHFLITKKISSVIYEDSISNFETGSGRTTKIYNSVKRADTKFETQADKQIHDHVWGSKTKWIGRNVSAYASSYTCVNCLKSLYQIKKEDLEYIKIENQIGRIVSMTSPYGEIKGYLTDKKNYHLGYQFKNTSDDLKYFRKIVEDFARPPIGKNSEVLTRYATKLLQENGKIENLKKIRGNSAIFVCPFCQFVADADIQAAFMMAVRGYLRFSGVVPSENNEKSKQINKKEDKAKNISGQSFLSQTINYLKNIKRSQIIEYLRLK